MSTNTVYVIGHRNPDTDSIVSAMAYAALQNALGKGQYRAARLGVVSDETKLVLDRFGFDAPEHIKDIRTQIRDLDYDTPPLLNKGATVSRTWEILSSDPNIRAVPVTNDSGGIYGMATIGDVATFNMQSCKAPYLQEVPLFNLLGVIEGQVRNKAGVRFDSVKGEVVIALPQASDNLVFSKKDSVVICGDQPDMVKRAIELGVNCVIICQAAVPQELEEIETDTIIISTPMTPVLTARMVYQATPVQSICAGQNIVCFHLDDYIDDVKETLLKSRFRSYPILDENEVVVGTLTRYHVMHPKKKKVVLVDHNETAQSVRGLEQADILAIIDHHRLADIQTAGPVFVRNEPLGSTTTIVALMFQSSGLMPPGKLAGLMAAAILSDTVMFKSPTCTQVDIDMAERLARLANVSLDKLGEDIFSVSSESKTAEQLIKSDFKEFHIAGHKIAVSQITVVDSDVLLKRKDEFSRCLDELRMKNEYEFAMLMLTDILKEGSYIFFSGNPDTVHQALNVPGRGSSFFMNGVISRKKQLIPMITAIWG